MSQMGATGLSVEALSQAVGVARAGFYWHFKSRDALLRQLLDYWVRELTEVISATKHVLDLEPKKRLTRLAELVLEYDLARYDIPIRQWALNDAGAARVVRRVDRIRMDFVRNAFRELGFTGDDLEIRAMLFLCYQTLESSMYRDLSRKRRRELIAERIELLTRR